MNDEIIEVRAIRVKQKQREFFLLKLRAADLVRISYVAARGISKDKNAVQRILTKSRIAGISEFAAAGGDFPASIVLNWVNDKRPLKLKNGKIRLPLEPASAQLLDGQHRVEGLREAIKTSSRVAGVEVPVTAYQSLSPRECADIFLSINTEQRPVPRNLVYDLYGIASDVVRDLDAMAAKKIADELNDREDSPYYKLIRYPGPAKAAPGIALSSVVGVLKPLLAENGDFDQVGLTDEHRVERAKVILNWFKVIKHAYGTQWTDKNNVFRYASGFWGGIQFLSGTMLKHCFLREAFDEMTMRSAMKGLKDNLIWQSNVTGMQGRRSANLISQLLGRVYSKANKVSRTAIKV